MRRARIRGILFRMRMIAAGVVVFGAAILAVPILATRSSSNSDAPDGGTLSAFNGIDAGAGAPQRRSDAGAMRDKEGHRIEYRADGTEVIHIGDPIGVLRNGPAPASTDGGAAPSPSVADLQAQIASLRAQQLALQQQQSAAADQAQALQQMNDQLQQLNAQVANAAAQRNAAASQNAAIQAQTQQAIDGLGAVLDALASGNDDVGSALDAAAQSFSPQAQRDLAAARNAIANKNLDQARAYVQTAIGDAQAGR